MSARTVPVHLREHEWPLHGVAASRALEADALTRSAPQALMQRAGMAAAQLACALAPHAQHVRVMAGPGNNGGDGLVAATVLHQSGRRVDVALFADAAALNGDAAWALAQAHAAGVPVRSMPGTGEPDLYIDALLGLGAARPISGAMETGVQQMNAQRAPVLAIDLPSGLNADTGAPQGPAVRADHTLSLLTLKPGLFTAAGRDLAGRVWFEDLGVDAGAATACARLAGLSRIGEARRERRHASHKGSYGDVCVIGGDRGMVGAAWLAAHAALAAGAGRIYCSPLDEAADLFLPDVPELMGRRRMWQQAAPDWKAMTAVCGCGGGDAVREALPPLLAHAPRLVLDADALNAVAGDTGLQQQLQRRASRGLVAVLTPHPLEAARLLGCRGAEVQADRLRAARTLADRFACVAVLKGSGTIIAGPRGLPCINPSGNAALASAGTGDVLAGWIGGTWSSIERSADPWREAFDAAVASVWLHGHAADSYRADGGHGPLTASALIKAMRHVH